MVDYLQSLDASGVDPTSPMGYVGTLNEIEQAMLYASSPSSKNIQRQNLRTEPANFPVLDEARAIGDFHNTTRTRTRTTRTTGRRRRRRRPHSAGRVRSKSNEQTWTKGALTHHISKKRPHKSRKQRPASAGSRRSTRQMNSSASAPAFEVKSHPLLKSTIHLHVSPSRKHARKKEIRRLEQSWNSEFAQNLNANKLIGRNAASKDVGESRRREWMNHNQDQFTALNQLRRAILNKREQDEREQQNQAQKRRNLTKQQRRLKSSNRKKKKEKLKFHDDSDSNLTMSGKTRMRTRRMIAPLGKNQRTFTPTKRASKKVASQATLEEMKFVKQCTQIRSLFEDLKLPKRDRWFFTKTFMSRYDKRNAAFVMEQLNLLHAHRDNTLRVLACIRRRETAVKQLHAVAKACVSALCSNSSSSSSSSSMHLSRNSPNNSVKGTTAAAEAAAAAASPVSRDQQERFRAILIDAAKRAQETSCDVVEAIVPWRRDFWRPHPFKWKSKNYLLRMGNCVGLHKFVVDANYVRALKMCQLPQGCFDILLPPDACVELCTVRTAPVSPPAALTSKRVADAYAVIKKEVALVKELAKELDNLLDKGYFIPRLRWNPNKLMSNSSAGKADAEDTDEKKEDKEMAINRGGNGGEEDTKYADEYEDDF